MVTVSDMFTIFRRCAAFGWRFILKNFYKYSGNERGRKKEKKRGTSRIRGGIDNFGTYQAKQ
jgi:hypothetical protein